MIGTLVGFGLALGGDRRLAARRRGHERVRSLQAVADRIFHARALRELPADPPAELRVLAKTEDADRDRVAQSVLETRDLIQKVIGQLRPTDPAQRGLIEMHAACLRYLTMEMEQPAAYIKHLRDLRRELDHGQHKLLAISPGLVIREPGSADRVATLGSHVT
ncbi:MAG TPA: hypothetical protein VG650_15945 [Mycobacteriales bacterium]|nr:hypothetical protein [Mycobacteriales bacterium]